MKWTHSIVTASKFLFDAGLPLDVVNIIIERAFKRVNKICMSCSRIDLCENCKQCRFCNENYGSRSLCDACIKDGWYVNIFAIDAFRKNLPFLGTRVQITAGLRMISIQKQRVIGAGDESISDVLGVVR